MKNYIQPGHTITLTAPAAVTSGSGLLVGAIFGIAAHDAASGEPVETLTVGVVDINKVGDPGLGRRRQDLLGQYQQAGDQDGDRQHADRRGARCCR